MESEEQHNKYSEQNLQQNKVSMRQLMQSAPIAGVYAGENESYFQPFFDAFIASLKIESGPKGECSKVIKEILSKDPHFYDEVLSLISRTHESHIRDIYMKYTLYSPCPEYHEFNINSEILNKKEEAYQNILDQNSKMYQSIKKDLIEKNGADFDYQAEILAQQEDYKVKVETMRLSQAELKSKLDKSENYERYMNLKKVMTPFFNMWKESDKKMGFKVSKKGDLFEKIVLTNLIPIILKRTKIQSEKIKVEKNCKWSPRSLGEIDIAILVFNEETRKWEAKVLIECKSRLFDIREAYKQVALINEQGKEKLCTTVGVVDVDKNYEYFIVTTLPESPKNSLYESKMKENLERASKMIPIDEIDANKVYNHLRDVFKDELSPLDWFIDNDSDRIIVLNY